MKGLIMAGGEGADYVQSLVLNQANDRCHGKTYYGIHYRAAENNNVTEIAVTLQYLPHVIMDHFGDGSNFGVKLEYFIEQTPLGTAGSVKNAQDFFDDDFIIISGDCLTDINISKAIEFHKQKNADATLILSSVENPLEYGVVVTDSTGSVTRFLEKPSWGEVFSDTVNTGIYIINPKMLNLFNKNENTISAGFIPEYWKIMPLFMVILMKGIGDIGDFAAYKKCIKIF